MDPTAISLLRGMLYQGRKKEVSNPDGAGGKSGKIVKDQNDTQQSTAEVIAAETGVSPATVKRDAKFAEAARARARAGGMNLAHVSRPYKEAARARARAGGGTVTQRDRA